jgi:hypothetical protein
MMPELFERRGSDICIMLEWPGGATWAPFWPWILTKRYVWVGDRPWRGDEFQQAIQYATVG